MAQSDVPPCALVIFGASGDLTNRKLIPALHSLDCGGLLPEALHVLGVARTEFSDAAFRQHLRDGVEKYGRFKPKVWEAFAQRLYYMRGDYRDPDTFRQLAGRLHDWDERAGTQGNRLFYLAVPPMVYLPIIEQLRGAGLKHSDTGWTRIIIEKPFGRDLESARALNASMHACFDEEQVYRIDHYLGKETVQNILAFRFGNTVFEPLWNRNYIEHVQITVAEDVGVEHRAEYYDQAGVLRDMFQNHLMQLLTLTTMEPPVVFEADALRDEKFKILQAVPPIERSARGQYRGYCDEPEVADDSDTATFAALQLWVENWRWHDVPFYLRSGKKLAAKATEILIHFRRVPHMLFSLAHGEEIAPNLLSLCIQPDEGFHLSFNTKRPGAGMETRTVDMHFHYAEDFGEAALPEAYERLLLDAIQGDASLFARADEVEIAWSLIDPLLESWHTPEAPPLQVYEPGSWGPERADLLLDEDGRHWVHRCGEHQAKG